MSDNRYSELKFNGQTYTEQWKIDEILIKNKFNWMVNAEIKNARLEIFENTLVWNAGIWYNGSWYFGVWRDGEWRYGTWQNGVWYNGVWRDGTFKSGIIYKGKFFKGTIESGEIRGGQFIDIKIDPKVVEYTEDEYQVKKQEEQKSVQQAAVATAQPAPVPQTDTVKVHSTPPASQQPVSAQPRIQQEKINHNMKKIKTFGKFLESVGEYEDSFVKVNIDETDLETSDRPNLGKLKQKDGKIIIETPSKTDAYNAKMRLGGDVIQEPGFSDKQIHHVKSVKESLINEISPEVKQEIEDLGIKLEGGFQGNLVVLIFRPGTGQLRFLIDKDGQFYKHSAELYCADTNQLGPQEKQNLQTAINKIKADSQPV